MRRLIPLIVVLLFLQVAGFAEQIRVTTWNLEWFPSGSPNLASPEVEAKRIEDAAKALKEINPDVILLQEIRDLETCEKLAVALKPESYTVAICSRFKDDFGGGLGRQQVAIIAKSAAIAAWSDKWKIFGKVDPPRGYSFAAFRFGTQTVGFYSVHLKSNLTRSNPEKEGQINILKRELAAEQVILHKKEAEEALKGPIGIVVVGGDFNTNPDQSSFVSEKTLQLFKVEGFLSGFENLPLESRVTHPGKGRYPNATFDYIFVKGNKASKPEILSSPVSDHYPVTRVLELP